jgi:FkbM family methyltransferase
MEHQGQVIGADIEITSRDFSAQTRKYNNDESQLLVDRGFGSTPTELLDLRDRLGGELSHDQSIATLQSLPGFYGWVDCDVQGHGKSFRMMLADRDDGVALRFFWLGGYEDFAMQLWASLCAACPGSIADIGAHTGAYSLTAALMSKNLVMSFEPHFMNFARLNLNHRGNGLSTRGLYWMALSDSDAYRPFSISSSLNYLSSGGRLGESRNDVNYFVKTHRLDSVVEVNGGRDLSLIKLDVEGAELSVLKGAYGVLEANRPVILFECTDLESSAEVHDEFSRRGYEIFVVDEDQGRLVRTNAVVPIYNELGGLKRATLNRLAISTRIGWWSDAIGRMLENAD